MMGNDLHHRYSYDHALTKSTYEAMLTVIRLVVFGSTRKTSNNDDDNGNNDSKATCFTT